MSQNEYYKRNKAVAVNLLKINNLNRYRHEFTFVNIQLTRVP